ncbi:MAG: DNA-processing protein DprA [Phycisphaerales bacterium]|nr:DNA-processing protein DprA [Phycisphaerales bacterium]
MTPLSAEARAHLIWALTDGVGPVLFKRILTHFGSAETALGASAGSLASIKGVGGKKADRIAADLSDKRADEEIAVAQEHGVNIVAQCDAVYPPGLKHIEDAPIVLFVRGELRETDAISIAIVGSRRCSIYGSEQARRFGELLAGAGFSIISGLARGIDAFAQHGALDAGGRSIGVLGNGLREIYPPENRALAERVAESGALVTELPMRTAVRAENFPSRNRIIAGMSLGTLVVEAADRSGALITARLACEYNREVFALPGRATDPMSQGTNRLIRDGAARLTMCLEDVLDELGAVGARMRGVPASESSSPGADGLFAGTRDGGNEPSTPQPMTEIEAKLFAAIPTDPVLTDHVLQSASLPVGEALAAMTALELKGAIRRLPGQRVARR